MSLLNLSSLRGLFAGSSKKSSHAVSSVEKKLNRKLAVDSLEDRILLSVSPNTATDILVNTEYSANQTTSANGNCVAVDADGDFVVTWTRGDNVYRDASRNVGWYDSNNELHLYTDRDYINQRYTNENGRDIRVTLTPYIDPSTGSAMVDYNVYARYFTDEVQRLTLDKSAIGDGNMLYEMKVQTGKDYTQLLTFDSGDANVPNQNGIVGGYFEISYLGESALFFFNEMNGGLQNSMAMQSALEEIFGEGNVEVSAKTDTQYSITFKETDQLLAMQQNALDQANQDLIDKQAEQDQLMDQLVDARTQLRAAQAVFNPLKDELTAAQTELTAKQKVLKDKQNILVSAKVTLAEKEYILARAEKVLADLPADAKPEEVAAAQKAVTEAGVAVAAATVAIPIAEDAVTDAQTEVDAAQLVVDAAKNAIKAPSQRVNETAAAVDALVTAIDQLQTEMDLLEAQIPGMEAKTSLITCTTIDTDNPFGATATMVSMPQEVQFFVVYEELYDLNGNFTGYGDIDAAATAEQIVLAFQEFQTTHYEGRVLSPGVDTYSPIIGPTTDVELNRYENFEVSVVPVYGLGENLLGFDITYVNSSGKQDIDQLIVTAMNVVTENYYPDNMVGFVENNPALKTNVLTNDSAYVNTLKQCSSEFRVNLASDDTFNRKSKIFSATDQWDASVALDADGDFVVAWTSEVRNTQIAGSFTNIYARTFSATMNSAYSTDTSVYTEPGTVKDHGYITLSDGKSYKATSNAILVNATTTRPQSSSCIAMDNEGNFTVVWADTAQEMSYINGINMQRFDAEGNKIGEQVRVDTEVTGVALLPQVAMSPDGRQIAVSWNWYDPAGISGIHYSLFGYSTDDKGVTTFETLQTQTQIGRGLYIGNDNATSIAFNKAGQFAIAWVQVGRDQFNILTADTYVSQFKWQYTDNNLKAGAMNVLRNSYRVNSSTLGVDTNTYWSGVHMNPSVSLDADGDFLVSYDGNGMDVTENVNPNNIVAALADQINDSTNSDLLPYFDPQGDALIMVPAGKRTEGGDPYGRYLLWIHNMTTYTTNGDSDSVIETILAVAQRGLRDENGQLIMKQELDENGDSVDTDEPVDPGCTAEQYARLSVILHSVFDLTKGEGDGVNFSMFDANPQQTLYPGDETILYSDSIANATRDGENAKYYIMLERTSYFDRVEYADQYVRNEDGTYLLKDGELVEKPVNQDDFRHDNNAWQSVTISVGWNGYTWQTTVDLSGCYQYYNNAFYRLNNAAAATAIDNAVSKLLQDAWPRTDAYEGCIEVRALSTPEANTEAMRNLDDSNFDLNGREPFGAELTCFEISFTGVLHDASVGLGVRGTYITTPCFQFDLNEATGKYFRIQVTNGAESKMPDADKVLGIMPEIVRDADGKILNIDQINRYFSQILDASLFELGYNPRDYEVRIVELIRTEGGNPVIGADGQPETYEVVEVTFLNGYVGTGITVTVNTTKPAAQNNNGGNDQQGGGAQAAQDQYPDWNENRLMDWVRTDVLNSRGGRYDSDAELYFNNGGGTTARSSGDTGVTQAFSSVDMTPEGDFTFAWTQINDVGQSIFYRTFNEEYDTVGPEVVALYFSDGQKIVEKGEIVESPSAKPDDTRAFILTFSEDMLDSSKITTTVMESQATKNASHSITNIDNWVILKDGLEVNGAISEIYFGMNASADPYIQNKGITALAENKWEAVVILNPEIDFEGGTYEIVLRNTVHDANGNPLNMDGTNVAGSNWERIFDIVSGSTETDIVTPETTDRDDPNSEPVRDADGNIVEREGDQEVADLENNTDLWVPNATATDPEGDSVTVWTSEEAGYEGIYAKITYTKWSNNGAREAHKEGEYTFKITSNATAMGASVDMDGAGDFVVTWSQNDAESGKADWNVWAQRFDLNGNAKGEAFLVNTTMVGDQKYSDVAVSLDGDFVITWQSFNEKTGWDIYAQRYDAAGNDLGAVDDIQVINFSRDYNGNFTLVFMGSDGTNYETAAIEYSSNAYAVEKPILEALEALMIPGVEFKVVATSLTQVAITVHVTEEGADPDVLEMELVNRNLKGTATIQTGQNGRNGEFMVNQTTDRNQVHASVDMDYEGNFVVSWTSYGTGTDGVYESDIFARQFESSASLGLTSKVTDGSVPNYITRVDGTDENVVTNSGMGLIQVKVGGGYYIGSGVLLEDGNNMYVLTAAHVVVGEDFAATSANTTLTFYTASGTNGETITAYASEIIVNEGYTYGDYNDLAIIKLTASLKGIVTGYDINRDTATDMNAIYTRYGFGTYGEGTTGAVNSVDGTMHTGKNKWEYVERGLLYYDFDDGTDAGNTLLADFEIQSDLGLGDEETCAAHGDSGGPCFVNGLIAGICHGGTSDTSVYGTVGIDTQVAFFASWIDEITGAAQENIIGAAGSEFRVNTLTKGTQKWSDVALDADGDFVITWTSSESGVDYTNDVFARRYDSSATPIADAFQVNTVESMGQQLSKVSMDADGDFAIVWESFSEFKDGTSTGDANNWGVYCQRYQKNSALGTDTHHGPNGESDTEFQVNLTTLGNQRLPNVAMTAAGDMIFTWQSDESNSYGIYSRSYYQTKDDAGPAIVHVQANCILLDSTKESGYSDQSAQIAIRNGDLIKGKLTNLEITLDEQVVGQLINENGINSITNPNNYVLTLDGVTITTDVISKVELVGYSNANADYPNGIYEKNIFRIIFKDGVELKDGSYQLTIRDRVQDIFGNSLDGNLDGEPGGDFRLGFTITSNPNAEQPEEELDPKYEPTTPTDPDPESKDPNQTANTTKAGDQTEPAIAMNDNGDYVVVWVSEVLTETAVTDDDTNDDTTDDTTVKTPAVTRSVIMAQRYNRFGEKIGTEFYVSDFVDGVQSDPDVAMDSKGNFVVTWTVNGRDEDRNGIINNNELAAYDVYAKVFDAYGDAITKSAFRVTDDARSAGQQKESSVAVAADSSQFVVSWTNINSQDSVDSYGVFFQRFNFDGTTIGGRTLANQDVSYEQCVSDIAIDDTYNVIVAWQASSSARTGLDVYARKFSAANVPASDAFMVNDVTPYDQKSATVACNDLGQFVIAWASQNGVDYNISFKCFNSNLVSYGAEQPANMTTNYNQVQPSIALTRKAEGGTSFAISWSSYGQEGLADRSWGVYMNVYDGIETFLSVLDGAREVLVNTYRPWTEDSSAIAMDAYGNVGVVWVGPDEAATGTMVTVEPKDTDIFHKVYYRALVPNYTPIGEPAAEMKGELLNGSVSYNSTLVNGGGSINITDAKTTIETAENSANKFVFTAATASAVLNNVALNLTGSGSNYVFDASNIGSGSCAVSVTGIGGESVALENGKLVITCDAYTLTILNATNIVFNSQNVTAAVTAADGEVFSADASSVALIASGVSCRLNGCSVVTAAAAGSAVAKLSGTEEKDEFDVEAGKVTMTSAALTVRATGFREVYLSGANSDSVVFDETGAFDVDGNVLSFTGSALVHASGFTAVDALRGGTAEIATQNANVITAENGSLVVKGDGFTQTFSGLTSAALTGSAEDQITIKANADVTVSANSITAGAYSVSGSASVTISDAANLTINGSDGDDFLLVDGTTVSYSSPVGSMTVNGFSRLIANASEGMDSAEIRDSAADDSITFINGTAKFNDNVEINGFASLAIVCANGGTDSVAITGSEGDDSFTLTQGAVTADVAGTSLRVSGAANVTIDGNGGSDSLSASDTDGDDTFTMAPGSLEAVGANYAWSVTNVKNLRAYQVNGGADKLIVNDSEGNDKVILSPKFVTMVSSDATLTAAGFAEIAVNSRFGNDSAVLYDSASDDVAAVNGNTVSMSGNSYFNQISGFRKVNLYSVNGGSDSADLKVAFDAVDEIFSIQDENWSVKGIGFDF